MHSSYIENIQKLLKKNEIFATATVVRRDAPSSGKIGDKAIINRHGEIIGWVGGGCVRGIILKEAELAMKSGIARLVKVGKYLENTKQAGTVEYKMTCQSEGTVEVFIEPIVPKPHIVIIGKTEIAKALSKLAHYAGYRITGVALDANLQTFDKVDELITHVNLKDVKTTSQSFIIVATQGEGDETAILEGLKKDRALLGFVASRKKWTSVTENLKTLDATSDDILSIVSPIGIDINAKSPEEVAISILAQMIEHKNSERNQSAFKNFETSSAPGAVKPAYYTNPVCGVPVDMNNPKHIIEYKGEKVYFCCDGCKVKFELEPVKYIAG
jgi:xanthine dehydrogenase accessory factor